MRTFIIDFLRGLAAYPRAQRLVIRHRLWSWLVVPGLLSVAYVAALLFLGALWFDDLSRLLVEHWLPAGWESGPFYWIALLLMWFMGLLIGFLAYRQVVLIVFAPLLGQLSETVEAREYGGVAPPFSLRQMTRDLARGLNVNLRYLGWSLLGTAAAWLLVLIPIAGAPLSAAGMVLVQAYFGGAGLMDPPLERRRATVAETLVLVRSRRGLATGVGLGFVLLLLIPVAGWFLAPTYGTIAGTIAVHDYLGPDDGSRDS